MSIRIGSKHRGGENHCQIKSKGYEIDPVSGTYRFMGEVNVNDKFVVDKLGNVKLAGNINMSGGTITWGGNGPVRYQFAASMSGPWHETMEANDKYRRDSLDGGTTWGDAYQFVGVDGRPGADGGDADVPQWVKDYTKTATYIDNQWVIAPNIAGGSITALNKMEAVCDFRVGNNIYLGEYKSGPKSIFFNTFANISSTTQDSLSISCENLDLRTISHINWGNNVPIVVFT